MKRYLVILFDLLLLGYMVFSIGFTRSKERASLCTEVKINMTDSVNTGFLKKSDIETILFSGDSKILGYPVSDINTYELEGMLEKLSSVRKVEIYSQRDGILTLDIYQRKPVVRVVTNSQTTYYIDKEGFIIPERKGFTPHVLIANGHFSEGQALKDAVNVTEFKENDRYREWYNALLLADYIRQDAFFNCQIVQLYFNRMGEFEMIPRVGAHQIIFGEVDNIEERFNKLRILYEEGLTYEGWNNYRIINLKYTNQIICTKR